MYRNSYDKVKSSVRKHGKPCLFFNQSSDSENPVIASIEDVIQLIIGCADNAVVTWTEPTVSDNSGYYTLISSYSSGELIPYGVTSVSYTATDPAGNTASFWFKVTVKAQTGKKGHSHSQSGSVNMSALFLRNLVKTSASVWDKFTPSHLLTNLLFKKDSL